MISGVPGAHKAEGPKSMIMRIPVLIMMMAMSPKGPNVKICCINVVQIGPITLIVILYRYLHI
jgi:hypothetical protein